ncbi:MAG: cyclase family protein [Endomicrobium sp.]|jgi:arylformamidase|nr:cyclase family protein [Endomicrobium sp.]
MRIIDISQPLLSCKVYPGDNPPMAKRVKQIENDFYNLTEISMSVHNGTHIDTPLHFIENGRSAEDFPLEIFYGKCAVSTWSEEIPKPCSRFLIKGNYVISAEDAQKIINSNIRLIGVESQSVGSVEKPMEVHKILLGAGVILLEGLNLSHVPNGEYTLSAFPLNISDCDGSPVRAVLIKN